MKDKIAFKLAVEKPIKETEKAVLLGFKVDRHTGSAHQLISKRWLPKSTIEHDGLVVKVKQFIAKKELNGMTLQDGTLYYSNRNY